MVTRKEVAELAGVSVTVVSRALNSSGYVAKEKKERVLRAAKELGYRPSPIALSLKAQKTKQILFISKDLENNFNIQLYSGMLKKASQNDYMVLFSGSMGYEKLRTLMMDGIIFSNEDAAKEYLEKNLLKLKIPIVSASFASPLKRVKNVPYVECDTYQAVEMLIEYLKGKGHEKIAFCSPYELYSQQSRHIAFISYMRPIYGENIEKYFFSALSKSDQLVLEDYRKEGEETAKKFIEQKSDATAIICFNDDFAIGLCDYFRRNNVRVPEDVSVVGIDGLKIGKYFTPKLTTVSLNPEKQGYECVDVLLKLINGEKTKAITTIPISILEGESVLDISDKKNRK